MGQSTQEQNKIQSLAKLIGNKNLFEEAFQRSSTLEQSRSQSVGGHQQNLSESTIGHIHNRMDTLLAASRTFYLDENAHEFNENEAIFFIDQAISSRKYHNTTEGCYSCGQKWKKASDLPGSHCDFCGNSNCKQCLCKTRPFINPHRNDVSASSLSEKDSSFSAKDHPAAKRGRICRLCDRKFLIREMVQGSLDQIKVQNMSIGNSLN